MTPDSQPHESGCVDGGERHQNDDHSHPIGVTERTKVFLIDVPPHCLVLREPPDRRTQRRCAQSEEILLPSPSVITGFARTDANLPEEIRSMRRLPEQRSLFPCAECQRRAVANFPGQSSTIGCQRKQHSDNVITEEESLSIECCQLLPQ